MCSFTLEIGHFWFSHFSIAAVIMILLIFSFASSEYSGFHIFLIQSKVIFLGFGTLLWYSPLSSPPNFRKSVEKRKKSNKSYSKHGKKLSICNGTLAFVLIHFRFLFLNVFSYYTTKRFYHSFWCRDAGGGVGCCCSRW